MQEKILQLAYNSFKSLGLRAVTVDYICSGLGISKKTFYQYFENKDSLVDLMIEREMAKMTSDYTKAYQESENAIDEIFHSMAFANKDIEDLNPIFIHDLKKYHADAYSKFMNHFNILHSNVIRDNIIRGVTEGLYRNGLNIETLVIFRVQSLFVAFDQQLFPKERFTLLHVTHTILENFLFGIATKEGFNKIQEYKKLYNNII